MRKISIDFYSYQSKIPKQYILKIVCMYEQRYMILFENIISHQLYIIHVILTHYMRANNSEHSQGTKNSKISRIRIGHSTSGQSLKRLKQKNNKSNQKQNIQNNNKNLNAQQKQIQGRLEYFNQEKNQTVKKVICNKNDDYCSYGNHSKPSESAFNKLKIQTSKGAIAFDGKIVAVQNIGESRRVLPNQSRSIEQFTQIIQKSETSKAQARKVKSKSHTKKSRNKSSKQKQKTKNKQSVILKDLPSKKIPYCFNYDSNLGSKKLQTKGNTETQVSFECSNIQNLDIDHLRVEIKQNRNTQFNLKLLKKVNKNVRSDYLTFMSKFCCEMKLNKDVFFLSTQLIDRYLNDQLMLNKHKILALASVLLCLKLDDSYMSKILNYQIFNPEKRKFDIEVTQNTIKKERKTKREQKKRSEQEELTNINQILKLLDRTIKQQFKSNPTADEILEFETLILIKEEFKIRKYDFSYWIDFITLSWDRFVVKMLSMTSFSKKLLFRLVEHPENYYFLVQIIEAALHNTQIYTYKLPQIVISAILLLCKANLQENQNLFDEIRINVQKSHNYLLKDKYGEIKLFLTFFEQIDIQMGDILLCCKFLSFYLTSSLLEKIFPEDVLSLYNHGENKIGFHRHHYNKKIATFLNKLV